MEEKIEKKQTSYDLSKNISVNVRKTTKKELEMAMVSMGRKMTWDECVCEILRIYWDNKK